MKKKQTHCRNDNILEMFKVGKIEHLNILERWQENDLILKQLKLEGVTLREKCCN